MPMDEIFRNKVATVLKEAPLRAEAIDVLQVNVGYKCNLSCKHCHVSAGPARNDSMSRQIVEDVLGALEHSGVGTLDITGGAPEYNPDFRYLVDEARRLGANVIVRTNLAVFYEPGFEDLPEYYHDSGVELVASLPYYIGENVDRVRGEGVFDKSIAALQTLNRLGFGTGQRRLSLVYNPQGAFLPPCQGTLEDDYRRELMKRFGVEFTSLFTFANMPIGRFREFLSRNGGLESYMHMLEGAFNPEALGGVMCRRLINVGIDGALYDCDFNQVLGLHAGDQGRTLYVRDFDLHSLLRREITVGDHCLGCTAGQGST